jgi:hypothetical protein
MIELQLSLTTFKLVTSPKLAGQNTLQTGHGSRYGENMFFIKDKAWSLATAGNVLRYYAKSLWLKPVVELLVCKASFHGTIPLI